MRTISIIGLGYVGLPLAVAFVKKYKVIGFDINNKRIEELKKNYDRTLEVNKEELENIKENIKYTSSLDDLKKAFIHIVTVPTPIDSHKNPDLTPLIIASKNVDRILKKGDIVIYESTVYQGCTEEICVPEIERESGLKFNKDFLVGYSPERINPVDKEYTVNKIKKVTSESTSEIAKEIGYHPEIILSGRRTNDNMGIFVSNKVVKLMIQKGHTIKGSKVLVLGITFKENCPDIRNSRVIDVIRELQEFGVNVYVYDSWVDKELKEVENELTHLHINSSTHSQVIFDKNLVDERL